MLLDEVLSSLPMKSKETKFLSPPDSTYLVWHDDVERTGSDAENCLTSHSPTFELYAYAPDPDSEKAIEAELDSHALEWQKGERAWIQTEQLYMTPYYFEYIEKEN